MKIKESGKCENCGKKNNKSHYVKPSNGQYYVSKGYYKCDKVGK